MGGECAHREPRPRGPPPVPPRPFPAAARPHPALPRHPLWAPPPRHRRASAFATTSGPIPRGSPRVTARRGRARWSGANVDVRRAAQNVEVVLYRELLAHVLADPILHVVEGQLTFGQALHELEYDELGPPRIRARREH